jgi:5-(carboxyamino)imidazole ribonucleotide mutase
MPSGVPVATVALNGAKNAGILAAEILGVSNPGIYKKLQEYKISLKNKINKQNQELND